MVRGDNMYSIIEFDHRSDRIWSQEWRQISKKKIENNDLKSSTFKGKYLPKGI